MKLDHAGDKIGKDDYKEELIDEYLNFFLDNFKEEINKYLNPNFVVRNRYCKWSYMQYSRKSI